MRLKCLTLGSRGFSVLHMTTRRCTICSDFLIARRRVTRTTYVCPHSADQAHRATRRIRRTATQIAAIECAIVSAEGR